jgi:hypothetical protein
MDEHERNRIIAQISNSQTLYTHLTKLLSLPAPNVMEFMTLYSNSNNMTTASGSATTVGPKNKAIDEGQGKSEGGAHDVENELMNIQELVDKGIDDGVQELQSTSQLQEVRHSDDVQERIDEHIDIQEMVDEAIDDVVQELHSISQSQEGRSAL